MNKLTTEQKERYKLRAREKRAKNRNNNESDIICRVCNLCVSIQGMSIHLKRVHNVNFKEYVEINLVDFEKHGWKHCKVCGKISRQIDTCSMKCTKIWKSRPENIKGITPGWNRGLTKETNETLKRIGESVSKANTNNPNRMGNNNPATRPEVRKKISQTRIERGVARGSNNPMFGKTHSEEALRKIFNKRSMTKPEKILKGILEELNIEYLPQFFINDGTQVYSYDFYLPSKNMIIEVDGDYWHGGPGVEKHWYGVDDTKQVDLKKDDVAMERGYVLLRFWESQLKSNKKLVIDILRQVDMK